MHSAVHMNFRGDFSEGKICIERFILSTFSSKAYNLTAMYITFLIFAESYSVHALHRVLFIPVSQLPAAVFPYLSTSPLRHQYIRDDLPQSRDGLVPTFEN